MPAYKTALPLTISEIRPLTREDLAEIVAQPTKHVIARLREPHHNVARLIAAGIRPRTELARRSGYTTARIRDLEADPAFQELISHYRKEVDAAFIRSQDDYYELATGNMIVAERMIAEKLEIHDEEGTLPPVRDLLAISRDAADRFGYGKKATNVNVNVDFASKLEQAIARSNKATINVSPADDALGASLPLIRRRA